MIEIRRGEHLRVGRHLVAIDAAGRGRLRERGGAGVAGAGAASVWRRAAAGRGVARGADSGDGAITLMSGSTVWAGAPYGRHRQSGRDRRADHDARMSPKPAALPSGIQFIENVAISHYAPPRTFADV